MTHVVTENCVDCKFTDCVEVCPVECFFELDNQLVIDPETCIDCAACVPECPVEAIYAEEDVPEEFEDAIEFNVDQVLILIEAGAEPIVEAHDPLPTAEEKKTKLGY